MAIADIFVPLTGAPDDAATLATAFAAARPFCAHVNAVFVSPDARETVGISDWHASPAAAQELSEVRIKMTEQSQQNARAAFAAVTLQAGARIAPLAERSDLVTASYREETGRLSRVLDASTRFADLVVFPPMAGSRNGQLHDAFIHMLLRAERPVLLSPEIAPEQIGAKPALGWDGGRAAAHALVAALPFLELSRTSRSIVHWPGRRRGIRPFRSQRVSRPSWREGGGKTRCEKRAPRRRSPSRRGRERGLRPGHCRRIRTQPNSGNDFRRRYRSHRFASAHSDPHGALIRQGLRANDQRRARFAPLLTSFAHASCP